MAWLQFLAFSQRCTQLLTSITTGLEELQTLEESRDQYSTCPLKDRKAYSTPTLPPVLAQEEA
jgi:hypothetical protein